MTTKIRFRNTSESKTIIVQKLEKYERAVDNDGNRATDYEGYVDPSITNTFKLVDLQNQTQISIPPNTELVSGVKGEINRNVIEGFGLGRSSKGNNVQHIGKMVFQNRTGKVFSDLEFSMQFDRDKD